MSVTSPSASRELNRRYLRLRRVAILMDAALRIPGTRFRFGLGSIIGLPPGAGDAFLAAISLWIVWEAKGLGVPERKLVRMLGNIAVETVFGTVPILGDMMDVAWKANIRNLAIIDEYLNAQPAAATVVDAPFPIGRRISHAR